MKNFILFSLTSQNEEQNKINSSMKVLLNISLPVKCKLWEENQHRYYQEIIEKLKCAIKEVN